MSRPWQETYRLPELLLRRAMLHSKPPIGDELANLLHLWNQWMGDRGASSWSSDWHVIFLKWALGSRAAEFKMWAEKRRTLQAEGALQAIEKVCSFNWPMNGVQPIFRAHWGWLHVELDMAPIGKKK